MDQQGEILIDTSDTDYNISADLNNTSKQLQISADLTRYFGLA